MQVHPEDAFGHFMAAHFRRIGACIHASCEFRELVPLTPGSTLQGLSLYPTAAAQHARVAALGWERVCVRDMLSYYDHVLSVEER